MGTIKREPAVLLGALFTVIVAAIQAASGQQLITSDIANVITKAIDPSQGGWAIPLILGIVTRFFVSPAK